MKIAAGHELKHKAAMSKVGDVEVGIPISITLETLRVRRGASVNSSKAKAVGVIFCMYKAYRLVTSRAFVVCALSLSVSHQSRAAEAKQPISLHQQPTQ